MPAETFLVLHKPFIEGEETTWKFIANCPYIAQAMRVAIAPNQEYNAGDLILVTSIDNVTSIDETATHVWVVKQSGRIVRVNRSRNWLWTWKTGDATEIVDLCEYVKTERLTSSILEIIKMAAKRCGEQSKELASLCDRFAAGDVSLESLDSAVAKSNINANQTVIYGARFLMHKLHTDIHSSVNLIYFNLGRDAYNQAKYIIQEKIPLPVMLLSRITPRNLI